MFQQDARDLFSPGTANDLLPGSDSEVPQRVDKAFTAFKSTEWECLNELLISTELSPVILRRELGE